ncbi:hypothetical protein V6N13_042480 [Hibiscus sabdariffa]
MKLWEDGYQGDAIEVFTPEVLDVECMKGEWELFEHILQLKSIYSRHYETGVHLQLMEDVYYISLLESVRSNYRFVVSSRKIEEGSLLSN